MLKRILITLILIGGIVAALLVYLALETRQLTGIISDAVLHAPIADARLSIANRWVTTNARGEYAVGIPRGIHSISVEADGYVPLRADVNGDDLFARAFALDLALEHNRVTLVARDAETQHPLPSVQIVIGAHTATTNAAGKVEARNVKKDAPIAAQALGYQPIALSFDGQANVELSLRPNTLSVTVIDQFTQQPLANAQIQADNLKATTGADGVGTLRRVKPNAQVRATATGYESAGAPFLGGDLQIALRPNTLEGVVTDAATGQPISGTLVYLGNTIVATNAQGAYRLENVPPKATLAFKAPGYRKTELSVSNITRRDLKMTPFVVKGIHVPFGATMEHVRDLFALISKTELNALVVDVKSEKGRLAWDSPNAVAKQIGAYSTRGIDLAEVIERCRAQNVYCIARVPVFQDTLLATLRPAQAVRYPNGTVFFETGGAAWVNPFVPENGSYVIALAKEIAAIGFDEVQFDYVRFPGLAGNFYWGAEYNEETRIAAIVGFLARAQKELRPTGVFISADVFGLTTATDDDQHTGQRLRDLGPYVDYLCPMVYPDTWVQASSLLTRGLQIKDCTEATQCPYEVVFHSYKRAAEKTSTKVRMWIQAYSGRSGFGVTQFRLQKKAAIEAASAGWMFWSGTGLYDPKIFDPK
ncbi:MAG: hypothetical protein FJ009_16055 [Chloroflexi bacterium]|nr:hypothetical protein [Chloroflexota bacterium]